MSGVFGRTFWAGVGGKAWAVLAGLRFLLCGGDCGRFGVPLVAACGGLGFRVRV